MASIIEEKLSDLLTNHTKISWQIKKIVCDFTFTNKRIHSDFYYWDFTDGRYDSTPLINYLSLRLIYFCLPYKEIKDALIPKEYNMIVTPKEIDDLIENMKDVVARGINFAIN